MVPFNKVYITGDEMAYITKVMQTGRLAGDGFYTKACQEYFEKRYNFKKALLTSSCTDALELAALLIGIKPGDEVIMPSYSFSSTANAFILRGAKIVFADSNKLNPNLCIDEVKSLLTPLTKAIVIVHYASIACDVTKLRELADKHKIYLIEDAAQAIDCFYNGRPLGSFGHLAAFSFHETKNITCGEGGLLVINDKKFISRAEIIREKGTNRASFMRKEIEQYNWMDIGSSFLPSDITAAYLYAQLNKLEIIMAKRREIWNFYMNGLEKLNKEGIISTPVIPKNVIINGHFFYFTCKNSRVRDAYIKYMAANEIQTKTHYITLHDSPYYKKNHGKRSLPMSKFYQQHLVRLPIFFDLDKKDLNKIISLTNTFFNQSITNNYD